MKLETPQDKTYSVSRSSAYFILIICSLLYMVNYMDRQVFAVAMEPIKAELGLSDAQMGTIQTMFLLGMALFSFPAAFVVDRWSRKKAISLMAVIWSIFTFLTGLGRNFWSILIPRVMVGAGEAGFTSGGTPLIAAAFPKESRGKVMGVFNLAIPLGAGIGMILGGIITQKYGWRTPFYIFAVPGVLLGILALFMKDYKTVSHRDESGQKIKFFHAAASLFKIPSLKWMYIGFAMQNFMMFSFLTWAPAFMIRAHNLDTKTAGMTIGIIALMAVFGSIIGGFASDAWQARNSRGRMLTAMTGLLLASIFLLAAIWLDLKGIGYALGIGYGIFSVVAIPGLSAVSQDVVPPNLKGASWGMNVFCMYVLGGAWGPIVVGAISDISGGGTTGLKLGLAISTFGGLLGALCYWIGSRSYSADMNKVAGMTLEAEE